MKEVGLSLEFEMNCDELYKFNRDYFTRVYRKKIRNIAFLVLLPVMFLNSTSIQNLDDLIESLIVYFIILFFLAIFHPLFVRLICNIVATGDLYSDCNKGLGRYRYKFTESKIYVHSPLGFFTHTWSQVESAVLTKEYLLLYVNKKKGYFISRSESKFRDNRSMQELIYMVENSTAGLLRI